MLYVNPIHCPFHLVVEIEEIIIAHVAISPIFISDGAEGWLWTRAYISDTQTSRTRIGSKLIKQALTDLKEIGAIGCVLFGDPNYYSRFGFRYGKQYFSINTFLSKKPAVAL